LLKIATVLRGEEWRSERSGERLDEGEESGTAERTARVRMNVTEEGKGIGYML
jgi:hypothetical protein